MPVPIATESQDTRTGYPLDGLRATAHASVLVASNDVVLLDLAVSGRTGDDVGNLYMFLPPQGLPHDRRGRGSPVRFALSCRMRPGGSTERWERLHTLSWNTSFFSWDRNNGRGRQCNLCRGWRYRNPTTTRNTVVFRLKRNLFLYTESLLPLDGSVINGHAHAC